MNRWMFWTVASLFIFSTAWADSEPSLNTPSMGQVTLNWQKFDELWNQIQNQKQRIQELERPEAHPPVPFTISQAIYRGKIEKSRVDMRALLEIDIFEPKAWVKIPFLPSTVALRDVTLDGKPVGVIQEGDSHLLLLRGAGHHMLAVRFSLKGPDVEQLPQLHLDIPSTPMTFLSLNIPQKNLDVTVEPSQGLEIRHEAAETTLTASLPSTSAVDIHWQKAASEEQSGPAKLYVESEALYTVAEGTLHAKYQLHYTIIHRPVREFKISVPDGWNVISVTSDGLQEWKPVGSAPSAQLLLSLAYARKGQVSFTLQAERAIDEKESAVELPRFIPFGVERESGAIGLEAKGAIELQVQESKGASPMDPQELPGGLWQAASQPVLYAFRYTHPYSLTIGIQRHPEVPVLTTTIDEANAVSLMTARGQTMTRVSYQVRNHLRQYLKLRLPKGAQLWSAFVAGEPAKPTLLEDGSYRIPLAKSQIDNQGMDGFAVEVIYYQQHTSWWPLGRRSVDFPVPDVPVSRLLWSLYLPERYRFFYFGGDLEKGEMAQPWNALLGRAVVDTKTPVAQAANVAGPISREENRNEELRSLVATLSGAKRSDKDEPFKKQKAMEKDLLDGQAQQALSAGVLPIAFEVPTTGQLFHFGQVMVVDQSPRVTFFFLHANLWRWIVIIGFAFFGWAGYQRRQGIVRKASLCIDKARSFRGSFYPVV